MSKEKLGKKLFIFAILFIFATTAVSASAHSGRTDSQGGHRDNKNASGLGSYHYHCGGHPAHLHPDGVCPYSSSKTTTTKTTKKKKESVKLNQTKKTIHTGKSYQLKLNGTSKSVKWKSSNSKVAKVSSKGKVTGVKSGSATITATAGNKNYTCKVTIKNRLSVTSSDVQLSGLKVVSCSIQNLKKGEKVSISISSDVVKASWDTSYDTDNDGIISLSDEISKDDFAHIPLVLRAVRKGEAVITIKLGKETLKINVTCEK